MLTTVSILSNEELGSHASPVLYVRGLVACPSSDDYPMKLDTMYVDSNTAADSYKKNNDNNNNSRRRRNKLYTIQN